MTKTPPSPPTESSDQQTPESDASAGSKDGDRIAKVIARAGVASRREAERMITEGRVTVNGAKIFRAALNVTRRDKVTIDGKPLGAPEEERLWLYHKPTGLVTTNKDEQGRATIFDELPDDLPRVMCIGRLDLNSEGLLLLTNDGGIKRKLELPSTGWLRRYRVRVNGRPTDETFEPLRRGLEVDGQRFLPMTVDIDRQQGANAWLTVGLREGKNREIRRAMTDIGLTVNRLIRVSFGPFQLGELEPGGVMEVRRRVMRDQLGLGPGEGEEPRPRVNRMSRPVKSESDSPILKTGARGRALGNDGPRRSFGDNPKRGPGAEGKSFGGPKRGPGGKPGDRDDGPKSGGFRSGPRRDGPGAEGKSFGGPKRGPGGKPGDRDDGPKSGGFRSGPRRDGPGAEGKSFGGPKRGPGGKPGDRDDGPKSGGFRSGPRRDGPGAESKSFGGPKRGPGGKPDARDDGPKSGGFRSGPRRDGPGAEGKSFGGPKRGPGGKPGDRDDGPKSGGFRSGPRRDGPGAEGKSFGGPKRGPGGKPGGFKGPSDRGRPGSGFGGNKSGGGAGRPRGGPGGGQGKPKGRP